MKMAEKAYQFIYFLFIYFILFFLRRESLPIYREVYMVH